jgi:hypothetical protein
MNSGDGEHLIAERSTGEALGQAVTNMRAHSFSRWLSPIFSLGLPIAMCTLAGCSGDRELQHSELAEIAQHHDTDLYEFREAQAEFARDNPMPKRLEFPGEGTLLLHECTLEGYPGHEELWLRYTYVNTTGRVLDAARITLTISDPETHAEWSEDTKLILPLGFRLGPDSSYTTYVHVPTSGMNLHPHWQWKIRAQAVGGSESSTAAAR